MTFPITSDEVGRMRALASKGHTLEEIATKLGRSYDTIRKRVRAHGIEVRLVPGMGGSRPHAVLPPGLTQGQVLRIEERIANREGNAYIAGKTGCSVEIVAAVRAARKSRLRRERENAIRRHEYTPRAKVYEGDGSLCDRGDLLAALQAHMPPHENCHCAHPGRPVRFGGMARVGA